MEYYKQGRVNENEKKFSKSSDEHLWLEEPAN